MREEQRQELYRSIWSMLNKARGSIDGWDFKNYVFGMMFYRFISENLTRYINEDQHNGGDKGFNYAKINDVNVNEDIKNHYINDKGFFIKPSELFENVWKSAKNNDDLNVTLSNIFKSIESTSVGTKSEENFKGLFDEIDFNSSRLGSTHKEKLSRLRELFDDIGGMNLNQSEDYDSHSIDVFGDAYEYLMGMYASNAGKSGGEYFTPQEVSELLTRIAIGGKKKLKNVYDPTIGSGSLLLKFAKILGKDNISDKFYGQEKNLMTYNLARINMFLHNIEFNKFDIKHGDTLLAPYHESIKFEAIVSNPPYSISWPGKNDSTLINDDRFSPAGVLAPSSKADFAFIMHMLDQLDTNGIASIVTFPGIFYRSGAEQKIRKYLVDNNFIDAIIALPDNLFYGTSIATNILVLKKNKQDNNILFVDASNLYQKVNNGNKLREEDINSILNIINKRENKDHESYAANPEEIKEKNYDLSVNSYVEKYQEIEIIDIDEVNKELDEIVIKNDKYRKEIKELIKEIE